MTYQLVLGDRAYSSWSLRGWLMFEKFGLVAQQRYVDFATRNLDQQMADLSPARTVPCLVTPDGALIWDSLAITEELATRHPDAGIWPTDSRLRATARTLVAEMHSGFSALRTDCPMNLRAAYSSYIPSDGVRADVARLDTIWNYALQLSGGPWLCGPYSAADAFFAPVAARIAGYGLPVSSQAQTYVDMHLHDAAFRRWRAMALTEGQDLPWYARDMPQHPWPGPHPLDARAVLAGPPENPTCPYSGKPATHFLQLDARVFGFCNAFCRDKTLADAKAWPEFMDIYLS